jgi:hypothetical protein
MLVKDLLASTVAGDMSLVLAPWIGRCRPKILIVTDGLNYQVNAGFGLTRFIEALTNASPKPIITLAYRGVHATPVTIANVSYPVLQNFTFGSGVTVAAYDQLWLFGVSNSQALGITEVKQIADFMNAGGGVFATGDHLDLGLAMCGQLPRIRHMREWSAIPSGAEGNPTARDRIDTIVNPGSNNLYDFDDQGDSIPQQIYPNYQTTWSGGTWTATIHPLLRLPNSPGPRTNSSHFTNDMDVMPDHAHESVCYEVPPAALNGNYTVTSPSFQEFPNALVGGGRVGSQIVAFGVSGGRALAGKPPVNPRMFGIISAHDGHSASPYSGLVARPGRIVCDATWHHFINVNLDGTSTSSPPATGLGSYVNNVFVPNAALVKISTYFQNILDWIQPLNRRNCKLIYDWVGLRLHPALVEELIEAPRFDRPEQFEHVGSIAMHILDSVRGPGSAAETVRAVLRHEGSAAWLGDALDTGPGTESGLLLPYVLGKGLAQIAEALPLGQTDRYEKLLGGDGHDRFEQSIGKLVARSAVEALAIESERTELRAKALNAVRKKAAPTPSKR